MPAILPFLSLALFTVLGLRHRLDWRRALLLASLPWAISLVLLTELLSCVHQLTRVTLAAGWSGIVLACGFLLWKEIQGGVPQGPFPSEAREALPGKTDWQSRWLGIATVVLVVLVGCTALLSAPNTWDAMEYHLPRVVMWMTHRGVQFYPTPDRQQLGMPPFAEYTMLHLDLLYGGDRLVALVQWIFYAGFMVAASLIAEELGGTRRAQTVAAALSAALPSAILGASGTKNDCVLAYWIACAVYLLLRWRTYQGWARAAAVGAALGLAIFTKGTAYAFLPFMAVACVLLWSASQQKRFLRCLPAAVAVALVLCAPFWARNAAYSGSILGLPYFDGKGDVQGRMFRNAHIGPAQITANVLRSVSLHLGVPDPKVNAWTTRVIAQTIRDMGVDPDDPGQIVLSQTGRTKPFVVVFNPRNEVFAGDTAQLFLFLLALALSFVLARRKKDRTWIFGLGVAASFVLYCALLRWSPWNARYQLPLFVLGAAFTAPVLERTLPARWPAAAAGLVLLAGIPLALTNATRPLLTRAGLRGSLLTLPRDETYFLDEHQDVAAEYIAAAQAVRAGSCRSVGLDVSRFHFDYPMMALLSEDGTRMHFRYAGVENSTQRYETTGSPVCAVVCLNCKNAPDAWKLYTAPGLPPRTFGEIVVFPQATRSVPARGEKGADETTDPLAVPRPPGPNPLKPSLPDADSQGQTGRS